MSTIFSNTLGHVKIVIFLLANGAQAKLNEKDESDRTPLYLSVSRGHLAVVKALVSQGAIVDKHCKDGKTALIISAGIHSSFHTPFHILLFHHSIHPLNVLFQSPQFTEKGHVQIIAYLVSECAADVNLASTIGDTPLHAAGT